MDGWMDGWHVCVSAADEGQLLIDNEEEWLHFGRGFVVYICFLKGGK